MPSFDFQTAPQVTAGCGSLARLPELAKGFGSRVLVVTGRSLKRAEQIGHLLQQWAVHDAILQVEGEPTLEAVREGVRTVRSQKLEFVIGVGGGSAIDAAKAIAVLATNSGEPLDYLEVIGRGAPLQQLGLPCIAIPTTAGTGAEVTRNAVLLSPEHQLKVSLRGAGLLPRLAIVDPELTLQLPPEVTANTGLDALTQLLETFVCHRANVMTDLLCREGLRHVARSLRRAYQNARSLNVKPDVVAREDMAFASLFSGMALANAGLGAVHGFASPLGGTIDAPHGAICASLLPAVIKVNIEALKTREPGNPALSAYRTAAQILSGTADYEALTSWVTELRTDLGSRSLRELGLDSNQFTTITSRAAKASSMRGNPIALTEQELMQILEESWDF